MSPEISTPVPAALVRQQPSKPKDFSLLLCSCQDLMATPTSCRNSELSWMRSSRSLANDTERSFRSCAMALPSSALSVDSSRSRRRVSVSKAAATLSISTLVYFCNSSKVLPVKAISPTVLLVVVPFLLGLAKVNVRAPPSACCTCCICCICCMSACISRSSCCWAAAWALACNSRISCCWAVIALPRAARCSLCCFLSSATACNKPRRSPISQVETWLCASAPLLKASRLCRSWGTSSSQSRPTLCRSTASSSSKMHATSCWRSSPLIPCPACCRRVRKVANSSPQPFCNSANVLPSASQLPLTCCMRSSQSCVSSCLKSEAMLWKPCEITWFISSLNNDATSSCGEENLL
mmetsp:Transcript_15898/g.40888  ORF Transcript_15898/g.40888 Transcript_15898/m.40888 type:complete len:352 (+) Transcript_15898:242-1297(+)